jgi:hypothetical protein
MNPESTDDSETDIVFKKLSTQGYSRKASNAIYDWYHR